MNTRGVVMSGGGTGGHLFPALAVARALREIDPGLPVVFAGGRRRLEAGLLAGSGFPFVPLAIEGLVGRGWKSLRGAALLPVALAQALALLARTRPRLVVGAGGYSSGPVVLPAALLGVPTLLLESNVRPGFTNRMLRPWARAAAVAFPESVPYFKGKAAVLGNPVRSGFERIGPSPAGPPFTVLVFGGSQGSAFLNEAFGAALPLLAARKADLCIVHQTGEKDLVRVRERYRAEGFTEVETAAFFDDMPARFARANLVVCRAGATTCAELVAAGRAAVLVPFAAAAEGHQLHNAKALEKAGGAVVLEEKDCAPRALAAAVLGLAADRGRIAAMEAKLAALRRPGAAERIARLCLDLMGRSEGKD
ncbi:MAG: undecaprenyldiphospho-muramoylpentapeptide beta-N-acetylglucosaminyltransferase [Candidatus Aminicenantes bacterium]|nr:undecaprenyldiphospho-muramoylpentapeptide beta-N-acetylglucosaminyltransferase [Candidatus Aminicenantes bacterium]